MNLSLKDPKSLHESSDWNASSYSLYSLFLLFIAGDLNAKIGRKLDESETFVGQYSKKYGSRNENGDRLAQFAASNDLFLTNTAFCHPSRHISTWHGTFLNRNTHRNQDYHNQIDYVLCRLVDKQILLNARSYRGSIARTDHSVVVTTIDLSKYHSRIQPLQKQKPRSTQVNRSSLSTNPALQALYQTTLQQLIMDKPAPPTATRNEHWTLLQHQIKAATTATLPSAPKRTTSHPKYHTDDIISTLSARLRQVRLLLERPKSTPYPPGFLRSHYVNERTRIKHAIIKRQHHLHNARLDGIASMLDNCSKSKPAEQFAITHQLLYNKKTAFTTKNSLYNKKQPFLVSSSFTFIFAKQQFLSSSFNRFNSFKKELIAYLFNC